MKLCLLFLAWVVLVSAASDDEDCDPLPTTCDDAGCETKPLPESSTTEPPVDTEDCGTEQILSSTKPEDCSESVFSLGLATSSSDVSLSSEGVLSVLYSPSTLVYPCPSLPSSAFVPSASVSTTTESPSLTPSLLLRSTSSWMVSSYVESCTEESSGTSGPASLVPDSTQYSELSLISVASSTESSPCELEPILTEMSTPCSEDTPTSFSVSTSATSATKSSSAMSSGSSSVTSSPSWSAGISSLSASSSLPRGHCTECHRQPSSSVSEVTSTTTDECECDEDGECITSSSSESGTNSSPATLSTTQGDCNGGDCETSLETTPATTEECDCDDGQCLESTTYYSSDKSSSKPGTVPDSSTTVLVSTESPPVPSFTSSAVSSTLLSHSLSSLKTQPSPPAKPSLSLPRVPSSSYSRATSESVSSDSSEVVSTTPGSSTGSTASTVSLLLYLESSTTESLLTESTPVPHESSETSSTVSVSTETTPDTTKSTPLSSGTSETSKTTSEEIPPTSTTTDTCSESTVTNLTPVPTQTTELCSECTLSVTVPPPCTDSTCLKVSKQTQPTPEKPTETEIVPPAPESDATVTLTTPQTRTTTTCPESDTATRTPETETTDSMASPETTRPPPTPESQVTTVFHETTVMSECSSTICSHRTEVVDITCAVSVSTVLENDTTRLTTMYSTHGSATTEPSAESAAPETTKVAETQLEPVGSGTQTPHSQSPPAISASYTGRGSRLAIPLLVSLVVICLL